MLCRRNGGNLTGGHTSRVRKAGHTDRRGAPAPTAAQTPLRLRAAPSRMGRRHHREEEPGALQCRPARAQRPCCRSHCCCACLPGPTGPLCRERTGVKGSLPPPRSPPSFRKPQTVSSAFSPGGSKTRGSLAPCCRREAGLHWSPAAALLLLTGSRVRGCHLNPPWGPPTRNSNIQRGFRTSLPLNPGEETQNVQAQQSSGSQTVCREAVVTVGGLAVGLWGASRGGPGGL